MNHAPLSHHIADALKRGYRTIAYRDASQDDLIREAARTVNHICRGSHPPRSVAVVTADREDAQALKDDLVRYGHHKIGRIGLNRDPIQIGPLDRLARRLRQTDESYDLIVLLARLDRSLARTVLMEHPGHRVLDLDPHAGPSPRPADHILYRSMTGDIESLDQAQISQMKH